MPPRSASSQSGSWLWRCCTVCANDSVLYSLPLRRHWWIRLICPKGQCFGRCFGSYFGPTRVLSQSARLQRLSPFTKCLSSFCLVCPNLCPWRSLPPIFRFLSGLPFTPQPLSWLLSLFHCILTALLLVFEAAAWLVFLRVELITLPRFSLVFWSVPAVGSESVAVFEAAVAKGLVFWPISLLRVVFWFPSFPPFFQVPSFKVLAHSFQALCLHTPPKVCQRWHIYRAPAKRCWLASSKKAYLRLETCYHFQGFGLNFGPTHQLNEADYFFEIGHFFIFICEVLSVEFWSCVQPWVRERVPLPQLVFLMVYITMS